MARQWMMIQRWVGIPLVCGLLGAYGCSARVSPPTDVVSRAELAVGHAADNAETARAAPLDLRRAREKLDSAKRAMNSEEYLEARRMAEQALVDAELAEAKAKTAEAQENAEEVRENIEALQREAERGSSIGM